MLSIDDNNELLYIKTERLGASQSQKYCGYRKDIFLRTDRI